MKTKAVFGDMSVKVNRDGTPMIGRIFEQHPLCGVEFDLSVVSQDRSRMTATRVTGGLVLGGPVGALLGGMSRKHSGGEAVMSVVGSDFSWIVTVEPKRIPAAQKFVIQAQSVARQYCAGSA